MAYSIATYLVMRSYVVTRPHTCTHIHIHSLADALGQSVSHLSLTQCLAYLLTNSFSITPDAAGIAEYKR